ncbi:[Pyruvate dehydrogenase (acetyl-transferring)] kinase isozyme 4 [Durusdinium trenchii]|uniref:Protein-serine/threonine kinase n=1 Tax=Durusdinium trenchii TaxID=1381693 RepID=A0ABP0MQH3_9DINO
MTAAKKLSYSLEPEVLRKYWSRILLDSTRILELPAFIHMHGDIVAQLIKLDEFEANEDRLWERLVEWSRKAVRDAEILGPFADATGETVKRSKSEDDSSGLGAHELAQQEAILSAMSKDIRFGAMNKEFFFHKARAFLSREKSDEIMEYFLLGNKPEQLQVAKRAGLVPKHNLTVETIHEITCATDDPTSPRENSQLAALARGDTGLWCPTWSAVRQLDVLDVLMGREVCIGEIVLTWEESRAIPRLIILETYADGKWHSMDCEISVSSDNGCRTTTHTPAVLSLATCMKFRLIFLPCRVEVASVRQIAVLCKQTIQQCANQVAENMLRADLSQLFVRSLADATPGAGGTLGRCLQRRRLQHGELSDRVTGAMTACVCVEGDSIAELQDHMNTTGHSEHRNPEQMARTTEPLGVPYKDALKADKLGREADFLAVAEGEVEHADVMAAFLQWDQNGDGVIDKDELLSVFTDLGLQIGEKELKSMFASADISHDKTIDYSEFLQWIFKSAHWQIRNQFLQTGVSWHGIHKGRNAVIQEDRLTVKRQRSSQERAEFPHGHAIVVSTGCAREFRFLLVDNDGVYKGGFEAGFSSMPPDELPDPLPECAKELSCAYVSSPTGHLVVLGEESEVPPWKHHLVASGTVVELKCKEGSFQVLLDGKIVANWPLAVPDEMDLYPLVSVYGTTCAIKLLPAEGTPSTGSKAEARTVQVDGGFQYFFYQNTFEVEREESKSMGWGMFFAYFACALASMAKYSFHQTEILIVDAFRFVVTDLEEPKGVSRDDVRRPSTARSPAAWAIGLFSWRKTPSTQEVPQLVLELISELGYSEKADFLYRGEGHIEDWGALLESLTLLCALRADAETKLAKPQEPKEGEDPMPQPKSDAEALEILKRKFRRAASVLNSQGAEQLRAWQATAGRRVGGAEGGNGAPVATVSDGLGLAVKEWLLEAGLQIDLDGLGAKVIGRSPFLVVSAERSALELEAERLGYIKPHRALRPSGLPSGADPDVTVEGYIGYEEHDFWLSLGFTGRPCERVQLLRHRIEEVPAPKEQMKQLKVLEKGGKAWLQVRHSTALAVSDRLLPALKIAGLVDPGDALGKKGNVSISSSRLEKFMKAEIDYFAQKAPQPVQLDQIIKASTPSEVASLIHNNLPVHFATRIKHLEVLPRWSQVPEIQDVHRILSDSFRNLRLAEQGPDLKEVTEVIADLRRRHKKVVPLLGEAIAQLRHDDLIDESFANKWLDTFLLARISTEMLTLHFMEMQECYVEHRGGDTSVCTGIVDRKCDPVAICERAVDNVKGLRCDDSLGEYGEVDFVVENNPCTASQGKIEFSFLPRYLLLLMEELLKNSAYATLLTRGDDPRGLQHFPVTITLGSNNQQVVIKISDRGGGVSEVSADKLWSYSWSRRLGSFAKPMTPLASFDDPLEGLKQQRLGLGLPLCRLYTKYLGGSLQLMSVPGVGALEPRAGLMGLMGLGAVEMSSKRSGPSMALASMAPKKPAPPKPPKPADRAQAASDAKAKAQAEATQAGMADALSPAQLENLKKKYDKNANASLDFNEFSQLCREIASLQKKDLPSEEDLEDIFDEFDKDDSDQLSMQEFNWAYAALQKKIQEAPATKVKGKAPPPPPPKKAKAQGRAATAGTANLSEAQLTQLRERYDTNQDKRLSEEEFDGMAREIAEMTGQKLPSDASLKDVFKMFDKDGSGTMSMEEFNWAYATLQQEVEEAAALKIQARVRGN